MVVSKAPAPPPGLEDAKAPARAADLGQYAFAPSWTPMGPMGAMGAMDYGAQWPAPRPVGYTGRTAAAAKAALEMFQPPGHEMRQRAEEAAMATKQRLRNAKLPPPNVSSSAPAEAPEPRREPVEKAVVSGETSTVRRYRGTLKVFKAESGYGFIDCEELKKQYGCDVFTNRGIEGGIVLGSVVSFVLEMKNGKPQARDARLEGEKSDEPGPRLTDVLGKVFKGKVKSFNVQRGFGFLTCPDLGRVFGGRDVYVSLGQVPGGRPLIVGNEVEFSLCINGQQQPQAKDLKLQELPEEDLGDLPTAQSVGEKLLKMG